MRFLLAVFFVVVLAGCTSQQAVFSRKSPHEQYTANIESAKLGHTALARAWTAAASAALRNAVSIQLPYKESGYFAAGEATAQGFRFTARRGENIEVEYSGNATRDFEVFIDLWSADAGVPQALLASIDTAKNQLSFEVKQDAAFVLRLQPELLSATDYTLTIKTTPSLGFPVSGLYHPRIGSFWGDQRDAGARSHEGLDIFGAFKTPVIAAADGVVTSVGLNRLGGKVVFLRPGGKNYVLYYAHLEQQLVQEGQRVRAGDTLGLMGNTGNAKNTPTHLHFGIYAAGGAIDLLPFINRNRPVEEGITAGLEKIASIVKTTFKTSLVSLPLKNAAQVSSLDKNTVFSVKAATGAWYRVLMPDSTSGYIAASQVIGLTPVRSTTLAAAVALRDRPLGSAAARTTVPAGSKIQVFGNFKEYAYASFANQSGWVHRDDL